jgi:4-hydroxybenzoate polyprenyltransferase
MLQKNNLKYQWPAQFPGLLLLCLIIGFMGTAALISFSIQNHFQLLFGLLAIIISTIYNQKILGISLRSSKGFKAFTISAVAIIAGVLIPAAQNSFSNTSIFFLILYGLAQLFFIAALCIAADIRDIEEDKEDHIKTFPVAAGLIISKNLIALLLIFQLMLIGISYNLGYLNIAKLEAFMIVSMISILFSRKLNDQKSYFYFIFGVDGLILGQSICILIIS